MILKWNIVIQYIFYCGSYRRDEQWWQIQVHTRLFREFPITWTSPEIKSLLNKRQGVQIILSCSEPDTPALWRDILVFTHNITAGRTRAWNAWNQKVRLKSAADTETLLVKSCLNPTESPTTCPVHGEKEHLDPVTLKLNRCLEEPLLSYQKIQKCIFIFFKTHRRTAETSFWLWDAEHIHSKQTK